MQSVGKTFDKQSNHLFTFYTRLDFGSLSSVFLVQLLYMWCSKTLNNNLLFIRQDIDFFNV